jgi:hypothetical protein
MGKEITYQTLAVLLVLAIVLSVGGTMLFVGGGPAVTGYQSASGNVSITVQATVAISLPTSTVNFGNENTGATNDTTNDDPAPFTVQNDGNTDVDVVVYMNGSLFSNVTGIGNNSATFRYQTDNSSEANSFNWSGSQTTWSNFLINASSIDAVRQLTFQGNKDTADLEVYISVPSEEPAGAKQATVTFSASQS